MKTKEEKKKIKHLGCNCDCHFNWQNYKEVPCDGCKTREEMFFNKRKNIVGFRIAEVYKTGEKKVRTYRGPKPQGYSLYKNGVYLKFLPY